MSSGSMKNKALGTIVVVGVAAGIGVAGLSQHTGDGAAAAAAATVSAVSSPAAPGTADAGGSGAAGERPRVV